MWYENFHSGVICTLFIAASFYISGPFNYIDTGRWFRRDILTAEREWYMKRDHRLTGNAYVLSGIESIKD